MTTERLLELAELAKAEQAGKTIQAFDHQKHEWRDKPNTGDFFEDWEYRIKQEPRVIWVNEGYRGIDNPFFKSEEDAKEGVNPHVRQVKFVEVLEGGK